MAKVTETSELIATVAARALAPKSGGFDYPMADAYTAAYKLRGQHKARAIRLLRALGDARVIAAQWEAFGSYSDSAQSAKYALRQVPLSWLSVPAVEKLRALGADV